MFRPAKFNEKVKPFRYLGVACAVFIVPTVTLAGGTAVAAERVSSDEFDAAFSVLAEEELQDVIVTPGAIDMGDFEPPLENDADFTDLGSGIASYYGVKFAGRRTANGETFDPAKLTAAHRTLPFGSRVRVTNKRTGRSVIVRINDRGPFHGKRVIDLSKEAARRIGLINQGHGPVEMELVGG